MATHSSMLAWRIPWTEEPGRLQSTGSQRAVPDKVTFTFTGSNITALAALCKMNCVRLQLEGNRTIRMITLIDER